MDKFLDSNKDFKGHEDIVRKCIQDSEAANPGATYEDILSKAIPDIRKAISEILF